MILFQFLFQVEPLVLFFLFNKPCHPTNELSYFFFCLLNRRIVGGFFFFCSKLKNKPKVFGKAISDLKIYLD